MVKFLDIFEDKRTEYSNILLWRIKEKEELKFWPKQ